MSTAEMLTDVLNDNEGDCLNACGVAVHAISPWSQLDRILILGSVGGTYYAEEKTLTLQHVWSLLGLLDLDGPRVVSRVVEISQAGRAPRNVPAVMVLALAASVGLRQPKTGRFVSVDRTGDNDARRETRRRALAALGKVCRIPTDLFLFVRLVTQLRGWGRQVGRAVARYYQRTPLDQLVLHAIKYETRNGYSHADLLRLSHPLIEAGDGERHALFRWMLAGGISAGLKARQAAGGEENATPSGRLSQLAAAEDLLAINGLGSDRAEQRAAERREVKRALEAVMGPEFQKYLINVERRRWHGPSESVDLFGVSNVLLERAALTRPEADAYLGDEDQDEEYGYETYSESREVRVRLRDPVKVPESKEPLFQPDEIARATDLIVRHSLPHEVVPSHLKRERAVWDALLVDMPIKAMVRNLVNMAVVGLLRPMSDASAFAAKRLRDPDLVRHSRLHPMAILEALETYRRGESNPRPEAPARGRQKQRPVKRRRWDVCNLVVSGLEDAFFLAFANVEPTGLRRLLALDVSDSMKSAFIGSSWLSARVASAAMSLITARTEPRLHAAGFTSGYGYRATREVYPGLTVLPFTAQMSLSQAVDLVSDLPFGRTDCGLAIRYAREHEIEVDCFEIYTDNEHNSGESPSVELARYRAASGIDARMIAVGMTATDYSVVDEGDPLCLNLVGFDSAAPAIMADFARGRI